MAKAYTLATYKVQPGKEDEFIRLWNDLASTFCNLPDPPYWGTLIRSRTDLRLFHSFGPWEDASHMVAMGDNPKATAAFQAIYALRENITPGDHEIVTHVRVRDEPEA